MYREAGKRPPKPEGGKLSLEELADKGAGLRRETDVSALRQEEHALKVVRDDAAAALRQQESSYVDGRAPLSFSLIVAGTIGLISACVMALMWCVRLVNPRPRQESFAGEVGITVLLVAFAASAMLVGGRAWRRRVLARTHAWLRSFPYPIAGFLEVFSRDWRPTSRTKTHPFGRLYVSVQLSSAVETEHRLADALAAVASGTLTVTADRVQITSEPFLGGSDAYAWLTRVVEQFVPALHEVQSVVKISMTQSD